MLFTNANRNKVKNKSNVLPSHYITKLAPILYKVDLSQNVHLKNWVDAFYPFIIGTF